MNELIWVGNILIPRGAVILVMAIAFLAPLAAIGLIKLAFYLDDIWPPFK